MLGAVQGPAELLPVSSSAHAILIPALLGWPQARLRARDAKSFEVALHAGSVGGMLASRRLRAAIPRPNGREVGMLAVTTIPAVVAGMVWERPIEQRLGEPWLVAFAQVTAGAALWAADRLPAERGAADVRLGDALALGVGQAVALLPGVSRAGAMLTAARLRGFSRRGAAEISWRAALPILAGATSLKGFRLARERAPAALAAPFAAGAAAAAASTVACAGLAERLARARSLAPVAVYRVGLGAGALVALQRRVRSSRP